MTRLSSRSQAIPSARYQRARSGGSTTCRCRRRAAGRDPCSAARCPAPVGATIQARTPVALVASPILTAQGTTSAVANVAIGDFGNDSFTELVPHRQRGSKNGGLHLVQIFDQRFVLFQIVADGARSKRHIQAQHAFHHPAHWQEGDTLVAGMLAQSRSATCSRPRSSTSRWLSVSIVPRQPPSPAAAPPGASGVTDRVTSFHLVGLARSCATPRARNADRLSHISVVQVVQSFHVEDNDLLQLPGSDLANHQRLVELLLILDEQQPTSGATQQLRDRSRSSCGRHRR